jgi:adenylate cyclase class IV
VALTIGSTFQGTFRQKDTFLQHGTRRLKLREQTRMQPELVYYARPDSASTAGRYSSFLRLPIRSARAFLAEYPSGAGERIIVRKTRALFLFRNSRIHIDQVFDLGSFLEFEVLMIHGETQAKRLLGTLMSSFDVQDGDIEPYAYADLLKQRLQA